MNIRALIVDDEALARTRLRKLLTGVADLEILGECSNGPEAIAFIGAQRPDVVFLDVQMPEVSGFDVLRALPADAWPAVIFVTAHDRHAIEAFEVHALDYLLKPFKQSRFKEALAHARELLTNRKGGAISEQLRALLAAPRPEAERLMRIPVRTGDRVQFVKTADIHYIEAAGNYVILHTARENHVVRETLTALESKLPPRQFLRISRSTLVQVDQIKELQPLFKGEHAVLLQNGKQLTMTRGLREVQEFLKFS